MSCKNLISSALVFTLLVLAFAHTTAYGQNSNAAKIKSSDVGALKFRSIGPALMSGRISDIAVDPVKPNTWYVAVGSGNIFKTENAGTTWTPIFENYPSYSIGCITIDPSNRNTIWVGTGENVAGRHAGFGDGVYVSYNAGKSFKNVGLKKSEHLSKIVVHPSYSNIVYVASQGPMWSQGGERGLYKTTDGGKTWKCILSKGPYTGVTDVVMHPRNPNILYAATYQKHRTVWALMAGGPESGIYKSTNGGKTWTELKNGIPGGAKGKISLAISPQKHNVVYAAIELPERNGGFYRSENDGVSFTKMSDYVGGGTGPHYYQEIWCDPHRFDSIYHANVRLGRSDDGGKTFVSVETRSKHVDNHAVAFHPTDPDFVVAGCDGGVYRTYDRCKTWSFVHNLPLTQFYKVAVDYDYPFYNVVGGTQDNNTQYGPAATNRRQGITNRDWRVVIGGDGHDCAIDPKDPNIVYGESQQGYLRRYDRRTGETVDIRPQPAAGGTDLRFNWDSPIEISFHDHKRLYFGSKKLFRSNDRGDSWTAISPDLSRNQNRLKLKIMGGFWGINDSWDLFAMSQYNNITSIGESPLDENLIYVGTDDGLIQVTEDGGKTWRKIDLIDGLPKMAFVNDIKACHHDKNTVFVCLDNHKYGDYAPYVIKSTDRGKTWTHITDGLPARHLVWRIIQDHEKAGLMFLGTEFGVFATVDGGKNWFKFSHGLPTIPFRDLEIQRRENDLVGATFGRGFYVLDDYSPLREVSADTMKKGFHLFKIKDAKQFPQADFLGGRQGFQGDSFYTAPNPPYGVTFTYLNKESYKSAKAKRKEAEAKAKKAGVEVPIPSVEQLAAEAGESAPQLVFTIRDKSNKVVMRITRSSASGMSRLTWNLRNQRGIEIAPGTYSVSVDRVHQGNLKSLQKPVKFQVVRCINPTLPAGNRQMMVAYYEQVYSLMQKAFAVNREMSAAKERLDEIESEINRTGEGHYDLVKSLTELRKTWRALNGQFSGTGFEQKTGVDAKPTIMTRIFNASGSRFGLSPPTKTHRQSFKIAQDMYKQMYPKVNKFLTVDMKKFVQKARMAGLQLKGSPLPKPGK